MVTHNERGGVAERADETRRERRVLDDDDEDSEKRKRPQIERRHTLKEGLRKRSLGYREHGRWSVGGAGLGEQKRAAWMLNLGFVKLALEEVRRSCKVRG